MAELTFEQFLEIFTTNDPASGRALKVTDGAGDGTDILTNNDPAGGRRIKIDLAASPGGGLSIDGYSAATNTPDLDTTPIPVVKGSKYYLTSAGDFFTEGMQVGDCIIAKIDNPTTLADWVTINNNIDTDDAIFFQFTGARSTSSSLDRDMESGGEFTIEMPFVIPSDCELVSITASSKDPETWEAHVYKNGVTAASLTITASDKAISTPLTVSFAAGDEVRLRQENGTGVNKPRITAFFKSI